MSAENVYVSYSWTAEERIPVVCILEDVCHVNGLRFQRDNKRLRHGDIIRTFMDEIGNSGNIIPVFSRNYFESEYCMYELLQVWKNGNFKQRIHPVSLGDIRLDDVNIQLDFVDFWERKTKVLQDELNKRDPANTIPLRERNIIYAGIYRHINELMTFVSGMKILPLDVLKQKDFAPLVERIKPSKPPLHTTVSQGYRQPDSEFRLKISIEIQQILDQRKNLHDAVLAEAKCDSSSLISMLCKTDLKNVIDEVLRPATEKCLSISDANISKETWEKAKSLLGWLILLSVDDKWVEQQEKFNACLGFDFEIMVKTPFGVEVVSSRYRQIPPKLKLDKSLVSGRDTINASKLETGWGDDYALERLLVEIWNTVFPEETKTKLNDDDIENLDETLKIREKNKKHHYYIPVSEKDKSHLNRREFYDKLLTKLPSIIVIHIKSSSKIPALIIDNESRFMASVREYLAIFHHRQQL